MPTTRLVMLKYVEAIPAPPLQEFIECYWTLKTDSPLDQEVCLPDGSASFIFNFGKPYIRTSCHPTVQSTEVGCCSLSHQGKKSVLVSQPQPVDVLGVRFKPHGLAPFYGMSMVEMSPPFLLQGRAVRPLIGNLECQLWAAENDPVRLAALNQAFVEMLPYSEAPDPLVTAAVTAMFQNKGNLRIGELLDKLCVSKSNLEKKFQEHVGLSPKIICNILRFNSIVYRRHEEPEPSLTELTYDQGFFDQSHLVHNFRSFTGLPPGRFFRQENRLVEMLRRSFHSRTTEIYNGMVATPDKQKT